jgi:pimeloyl-ACP methyl ester carboxylesterase
MRTIFHIFVALAVNFFWLSAAEAVHTVRSDGATIAYFDEGKGEVVVLLPGGSLSAAYLKPLAESLVKAGYRVVRINPRGAGESTNEKKDVSLRDLSEDVAKVIEELGAGKVVVAGHAYGNRIARMLAADHPELVKGVVLLAAGGKVPAGREASAALKILFDPKTTDAEYAEAMRYMVGDPKDIDTAGKALKASRAPQAGALQFKAASTSKVEEWWAPEGKVPYLVIQGGSDRAAPPENGELLKKDLGDRVTLLTLPDAGHLLVVTRPKEVADAMVEFLKGLPK